MTIAPILSMSEPRSTGARGSPPVTGRMISGRRTPVSSTTSTLTGCGGLVAQEGEYVAGEGYVLMGFNPLGGGGQFDVNGNEVDYSNALQANDPVSSETVWQVEFNNNAPILATAGGLVFQGNSTEGAMVAYDASTGEEAWRFRTGSDFGQTPVSYVGPDGRQYLAIIASGSANNGQVNFDDEAQDADRYARSGSTLYVWALPESVAGM